MGGGFGEAPGGSPRRSSRLPASSRRRYGADVLRTLFFDRHAAQGAQTLEFGGWEMPLRYPAGTVQEHLATRKEAGLFDVSHMGRLRIRGPGALAFLQHVLTNNAEALDGRPIGAQYTMIPDQAGGAVDDAYLYRFTPGEYLLVVNAANREKDLAHLRTFLDRFGEVELEDLTTEVVMLALQGPRSRAILEEVVQGGRLPEPMRNAVGAVRIGGAEVRVGRTGYTGEPIGFELFIPREAGLAVWDLLVERGATPCGLGARDTLRLEAGLPLYGHELGLDPEGRDIPLMAVPIARFAVSFSPLKGDYVGRPALERQFRALERLAYGEPAGPDLPRRIRPVAVTGRGIARQGAEVFVGDRKVGDVTSGTMVPYWVFEGEGETSVPGDRHEMRAICLAYLDSELPDDQPVEVDIRGKRVPAVIVPYHLRSEAPPYARPIVVRPEEEAPAPEAPPHAERVAWLLRAAAENTRWRQRECINLIPSEMTTSPMVRLLQVMDPAFRYAEHRRLEALDDLEVFYYQGTRFIARVEELLAEELRSFLSCPQVEVRPISGQMANTAVFSAMVDWLNMTDRRREPRRIRCVMNHHIGKGGHLSAQPMGALRDFVARDPRTERPAVVNFPVLEDDPFRIDVPAALELVEEHRPELIVFGKSMVLYREPVEAFRRFCDERGIDAVLMYDMAHVLGLVGPRFQEPFAEGADIVTGSTHKTYYGTQRGVIASRFEEHDDRFPLWRSIESRAFPGSVSNHHLGTLLGLLMAAYEMNAFKDAYQPKVLANAKAFARALADRGLRVCGDPAIGYTETHQVVVRVGYGRGAEMARRLEASNLICNYQALPGEEGFTAAGGLRFGVSEMTRFGMEEGDFAEVADLIGAVVLEGAEVGGKVKALRERFLEPRFCVDPAAHGEALRELVELVVGPAARSP